jgi:hypothetical protein
MPLAISRLLPMTFWHRLVDCFVALHNKPQGAVKQALCSDGTQPANCHETALPGLGRFRALKKSSEQMPVMQVESPECQPKGEILWPTSPLTTFSSTR